VAKNDVEVSGSSIMGLMMLAAAPGSELEIRARGPAASAVLAALADLVANKFDEDG
jgi:phosphocarrier protein